MFYNESQVNKLNYIGADGIPQPVYNVVNRVFNETTNRWEDQSELLDFNKTGSVSKNLSYPTTFNNKFTYTSFDVPTLPYNELELSFTLANTSITIPATHSYHNPYAVGIEITYTDGDKQTIDTLAQRFDGGWGLPNTDVTGATYTTGDNPEKITLLNKPLRSIRIIGNSRYYTKFKTNFNYTIVLKG